MSGRSDFERACILQRRGLTFSEISKELRRDRKSIVAWLYHGRETDGIKPVQKRKVIRLGVPNKVSNIIAEVAEASGVAAREIVGPGRTSIVASARFEAIWRVHHEVGASLLVMAGWFNRDHTTILYAIRRHQARLDAQAKVAA